MSRRLLTVAATAFLAALPAKANEFEGALRDLAEGQLMGWMAEPALIDAINAQNAAHTGLSQADIDALDQTWRAEIGAAVSPMIDDILARPGSSILRERKEAAGGLITEVFVTDNRGLNVAQSDITSDLWQGDEAKFTESYGTPQGTIHFGDIELDDSTQTYQSQISFPVYDPALNVVIGAVTFGVNLELLN